MDGSPRRKGWCPGPTPHPPCILTPPGLPPLPLRHPALGAVPTSPAPSPSPRPPPEAGLAGGVGTAPTCAPGLRVPVGAPSPPGDARPAAAGGPPPAPAAAARRVCPERELGQGCCGGLECEANFQPSEAEGAPGAGARAVTVTVSPGQAREEPNVPTLLPDEDCPVPEPSLQEPRVCPSTSTKVVVVAGLCVAGPVAPRM